MNENLMVIFDFLK